MITSSAIRLASRPARVALSANAAVEALRPRVVWLAGFGTAIGYRATVRIRRRTDRGLLWFPFLLQLPLGSIRLDHKACRILVGKRDHLPSTQPQIPFRLRVDAVRVGERVLSPGEQADTVLHGPEQHGGILQTREVYVACEVLDKLPDFNVLATPQRDPVQLQPKTSTREAGEEELLAPEPASGPVSKRRLAAQPCRFPGHRIGRRRLDRRQQPLVRLGQSSRNRLGGCFSLRLCLPHLMR